MSNWEVQINHDSETEFSRFFITDNGLQLLIRPTPLRILPVMISIIKHNYHGRKAQLWVDHYEAVDPEALSQAQGEKLISQLLAGKTLFAEYYEWPFEDPQQIQVALEGFAAAWNEARTSTPFLDFEEAAEVEETPWSQTSDSLFLAFQAVAVTATQRLRQMSEAHHTVSALALAYLQYHETELDNCDNPRCQMIFQEYAHISRDDAFVLQKEYRRMHLVASLTVLDTFLSDFIRFLFMYKQEAIPERGVQAANPNEIIEKFVRKPSGGYAKRLEFIEDTFHINLSPVKARLPELLELTKIRNEIVHDLSMYRYELDTRTGDVLATAKPVVEVSPDTAMQTSMLITEIIDAIFLSASHQFFQREPTVRPLTPEVAAVHNSIREERGWNMSSRSDRPDGL